MRRTVAFDRLVSNTLEVLRDPSVVQAVNSSALEAGIVDKVYKLIANAHLPNLRHNELSEPLKYQNSDSIELITIHKREAEAGPRMQPSMYQLTPQRIAKLEAAGAEELSLNALRLMRQNPASARATPGGLGTTFTPTRYAGGSIIGVRPIIFLRTEMLKGHRRPPGRAKIAYVVGHEGLHAHDMGDVEDKAAMVALAADPSDGDSDSYVAYLESRAHHFSACISDGMGATIQPQGSNLTPQQIEAIRLRHNTNPAAPFATPASLIAEYKQERIIA